ncbi:hypothetical protein G4228_004782 [Cervus hanglu yarkandensis]|nr:hypothetical protein G4228_004782 [Cervus hanglu yarkandensis]
MRKDKKKLRRLLKYMFFRDYKSKIVKGIDEDDLLEAKKGSKFRDWLDCGSMEIKPNVVAMEILAYLAYETVAQLVDLALLVRQDLVTKAGDPFSHAISATFIQYHNSAESTAACGVEAHSDAIQPSHIREAVRRYGHKIGPLSPFTSAYRRNGMAFLAC